MIFILYVLSNYTSDWVECIVEALQMNVCCCVLADDADVPQACAFACCHASRYLYDWPVSTERQVRPASFFSLQCVSDVVITAVTLRWRAKKENTVLCKLFTPCFLSKIEPLNHHDSYLTLSLRWNSVISPFNAEVWVSEAWMLLLTWKSPQRKASSKWLKVKQQRQNIKRFYWTVKRHMSLFWKMILFIAL